MAAGIIIVIMTIIIIIIIVIGLWILSITLAVASIVIKSMKLNITENIIIIGSVCNMIPITVGIAAILTNNFKYTSQGIITS